MRKDEYVTLAQVFRGLIVKYESVREESLVQRLTMEMRSFIGQFKRVFYTGKRASTGSAFQRIRLSFNRKKTLYL